MGDNDKTVVSIRCQINQDSYQILLKREGRAGSFTAQVIDETHPNAPLAKGIQAAITDVLSKEQDFSKAVSKLLIDRGATNLQISEAAEDFGQINTIRDKSLGAGPLSLSAATQTESASQVIVRGEIGRKIDKIVTEATKQHLSGCVRIVKDGEVILQKGYGKASETRANTPETIFRLASISKTVTAAAIMRLQDLGKLNVQDPISKHLPFVQKRIEVLKLKLEKVELSDTDEIAKISEQIKWLESITIEQLMTHHSGLPNLEEADPDAVVSFQLQEHDPKDFIDRLNDKPVKFEPGTQKEYNNYGFMLLAEIVEKTTGKPYEQALQEVVFAPLEMNATRCPIRTKDDKPDAEAFTLPKFKQQNLEGYIQWLDSEIGKNPESIRLKALLDKRQECVDQLNQLTQQKAVRVHEENDHCSVRVGSGNVNSNILNLAKFEAALNSDFLSKDARELMDTKGYGWDLYGAAAEKAILANGEGNRGWVMKDGEMRGGHTMLWRFPDVNASIIMLCNSDMDNEERGSLGPLSIEIAKVLLEIG